MAGPWTKSSSYCLILIDDGTWTGMRRASKGAWHWLNKAERKFEIDLSTGKDTLTLAPDGLRATGTDEKGTPIQYLKGDQRAALKAGKGAVPVAANTPVPQIVSKPALPAATPDRSVDILKTATSSLVLIDGRTASGSGFIATLGGARYLFTNQHILSLAEGGKFTLVDRSTLQLGASAAAVDHDVARIAVAPGKNALEFMPEVEKNASIGDDVVVLGNAEGQRVINLIRGKLIGIGPNLVEVDAAFLPGNSGSPIIHVRTGQVIGIATYVVVRRFSPVPASSDWNKVRRFGYRLDSIQSWQPIQPEYFAESAQDIRIRQLTEDLMALWKDYSENRKINPGLHQNPLFQQPIAEYLKVMHTPNRSENLAAAARKDFLWSLHSISQSDIASAKPKTKYDYFQRSLTEEAAAREEIYSALEKVVMMK